MAGARRASGDEVTTIEERAAELAGGVALLVHCRIGSVAQMLNESQTWTIGRGSDCDVVVDDESVSRRHAKLSFFDAWRVEDLGSRNGTLVDGHKLRKGELAPLSLGSVLRLGSATAALQPVGASRWLPGRSDRPAGARSAPDRFPDHIVLDAAMQELYAMLDALAPSPLSVLIMGETGVGKELFACALHAHSPRASRPMIEINCAAIPATMLESELFGFERGAFTGATQTKLGLLETAHGGTVLLDEVGELPLPLQAKMLRVLETGQVQRLGAVRPRALNVRILSSTNRDLRRAVADGEFRADLYHRLNGVPIRIPPLRERRSEIAPLAQHFASAMARTLGRAPITIAEDARLALEACPWPGNVRELKNVIERAVVLARSSCIRAGDLQLEGETPLSGPEDGALRRAHPPSHGDKAPHLDDAGGLRAEIDAVEHRRVVEALERCGNNQSRAARLLGISRHALIARIERFNLQRPRKGSSE